MRYSDDFWKLADRFLGHFDHINVQSDQHVDPLHYNRKIQILELSDRTEPYLNGRVHGEVKFKDGRPSEWYYEGKLCYKDEYERRVNEKEQNEKIRLTLNGESFLITKKTYKELTQFLTNNKIK